MSPSSGKASGKPTTADFVGVKCPHGHSICGPCHVHIAEEEIALKARIAELEAELASERTLAETAWRANADLVAANEKAEAEVKSLLAKKATPRTEERDEG